MMRNRTGHACGFLFAWILAATLQLDVQTSSSPTPEQFQMFQSYGIGQLLPTLPPIILWGLAEQGASALLHTGPEITGLRFSREQSSLAAPTEVPVSADDIVRRGSTVGLVLYGKQVGKYALGEGRGRNIHIPGLCPPEIAGLQDDQVSRSSAPSQPPRYMRCRGGT